MKSEITQHNQSGPSDRHKHNSGLENQASSSTGDSIRQDIMQSAVHRDYS